MAFLNGIAAGLTIAVVACASGPAYGQRLVWTEAGNGLIRSANLDGSDQQTLITLPHSDVYGIAFDPVAGHLYWVNPASTPFIIQRANLDGSNVVNLVPTNRGLNSTTEFVEPVSIALDPTGSATGGVGKMYVGQVETFHFMRSNLDGSNVELFVDGLGNDVGQHGVSLDLADQRMFWSNCCSEDGFVSGIYSVNLDGTELQLLEPDEIGRGVVYNSADDMVYWVSDSDDAIERIGADGGVAEVLVPNVQSYALALDPTVGRMFWGGSGGISSANLDGSGITQVVALASGSIGGIAIVPVPEPCSLVMMIGALPLGCLAVRRWYLN